MDQARLRPAQVGASTAAAVGGAFLATRLGVYGTIIGVGVITLMSTVGSEMLLRSLERTKQAARLVNPRQRGVDDTFAADAPTETLEPDATTDRLPAVDLANADDVTATVGMPLTGRSVTPGTTEHTTLPRAERRSEVGRPPRSRRWPLVAGGFLASFALALAVIVGIETFTGRSLHGDGSPTVVNVIRGTGQGTDEDPPAPGNPTDDSTSVPDDEAASDEQEGDRSQPDAPEPAESPAPSRGDDVRQRDDQTPGPGADTPSPDEEQTPSPEDETTPPADEPETHPPDDDPTPES